MTKYIVSTLMKDLIETENFILADTYFSKVKDDYSYVELKKVNFINGNYISESLKICRK